MPAYNLEGVIGESIRHVHDVTAEMGQVEIVVCDDGSVDRTHAEATASAARFANATVVRHEENRGKGAALITAFASSTMPTVAFLDGDLDLPPEQLKGLIDTFETTGVDCLVGLKQAAMEPGHYPGYRRVLSKIFSGTIRVMFRLPVEETQTGLKIFSREALAEVLPRLTVMRYAFDLELVVTLQRRGYLIGAAPVRLAEGASERGLSPRTLWEMGRDTLRIWLRAVGRRI